MHYVFILVVAGFVGGAINSIAGGGGILMYPALLAAGLSPLTANATASFIVWPGALTSAFGFRHELAKVSRQFLWLFLPCFIGSIIGSRTLVQTKPATFEALAPWLVLSAVVLLALQSRIQSRLLRNERLVRRTSQLAMPLLCLAVFPLAIYGGFFGIGFGLMMLAILGFTKLRNVYQMNGIKNLAGATIAMVSTVYFTHYGLIDWSAGLIMVCGTATGGFIGSRLAQKVSSQLVHNLTITIGFIIAIVLLIK